MHVFIQVFVGLAKKLPTSHDHEQAVRVVEFDLVKARAWNIQDKSQFLSPNSPSRNIYPVNLLSLDICSKEVGLSNPSVLARALCIEKAFA